MNAQKLLYPSRFSTLSFTCMTGNNFQMIDNSNTIIGVGMKNLKKCIIKESILDEHKYPSSILISHNEAITSFATSENLNKILVGDLSGVLTEHNLNTGQKTKSFLNLGIGPINVISLHKNLCFLGSHKNSKFGVIDLRQKTYFGDIIETSCESIASICIYKLGSSSYACESEKILLIVSGFFCDYSNNKSDVFLLKFTISR